LTEREKLDFFEKKSKIYFKHGGVCCGPGCGNPLNYNNFQLGHRIPQSTIDKYGPEIVHHELNMLPVCGLECNKRVDIGTEPGSILVLVEQILEAINQDFRLEDYKAELMMEIRENEEFEVYQDRGGGGAVLCEKEEKSKEGAGIQDIFGRSEEELSGIF